jgi:uncharacterized membrane protein
VEVVSPGLKRIILNVAGTPHTATSSSNESLLIRIDRAIYRIARRWLLIFNVVAFSLASLPFIIPFLASQGYTTAASWLHMTFGLMCHQMPERSFTLFGEQMALCHRMTAIYVASFVAGVGFALVRNRLSPIGFFGLFLLSTPMAIDGFTQLFGLRESTWELRLLTGSLFAFGVMWFSLPRLDEGFREIRSVVEKRFHKLARLGRKYEL